MVADARKPESAEPQKLADKLNKSGTDPMKEFKTGVEVMDKTVSKIDNGIRSISKKLHGDKKD